MTKIYRTFFVCSSRYLPVLFCLNQVQQRAINLRFGAKDDCRLSDECMCVCNQGAFADNLADVVDQFLLQRKTLLDKQPFSAFSFLHHCINVLFVFIFFSQWKLQFIVDILTNDHSTTLCSSSSTYQSITQELCFT